MIYIFIQSPGPDITPRNSINWRCIYIHIFLIFLELILKRTMVKVNYMNCLLQDRTGKHWLGFCVRFVSARMYFVSACLSCKCLTYIRPMFRALGGLFANASLPCFGENLRSRFWQKIAGCFFVHACIHTNSGNNSLSWKSLPHMMYSWYVMNSWSKDSTWMIWSQRSPAQHISCPTDAQPFNGYIPAANAMRESLGQLMVRWNARPRVSLLFGCSGTAAVGPPPGRRATCGAANHTRPAPTGRPVTGNHGTYGASATSHRRCSFEQLVSLVHYEYWIWTSFDMYSYIG